MEIQTEMQTERDGKSERDTNRKTEMVKEIAIETNRYG